MTRWGSFSAFLLVLALLTLPAVGDSVAQVNSAAIPKSAAAIDVSHADSGPDQEMVGGRMECVTDPFGGSKIALTFSGTAGIAATKLEVGEAAVTNPDGCDALATSMAAHAVTLGCATGQFRSHVDQFSVEASFSFVCQDRRDALVRTMGRLSRQFVTESP